MTGSPDIFLSPDGYRALLHHFEQGLKPGGDGIDVVAVAADPAITDADLYVLLGHLKEGGGKNGHTPNGASRRELAQQLRQTVDEAVNSEARNDRVREVTLPRPSNSKYTDMVHDGMHFSSPRLDEMALGTSQRISQFVLRQLRHAAGWVPVTHLGPSHTTSVKRTVGNIRQAYIQKAMDRGMPLEAAEQECQREYIAVIPRYHVPAYGGRLHYDEADTSRPTLTWVDLSSQAAEDFKRSYSRHSRNKSDQNLNLLYARWGADFRSPTGRRIREVVDDIRQQAIARHMGMGLSQEDAIKRVDDDYIDKPRTNTYRIRPAAQAEVDNRLRALFPDRTPDENARGR